jgi:hypothetical protein
MFAARSVALPAISNHKIPFTQRLRTNGSRGWAHVGWGYSEQKSESAHRAHRVGFDPIKRRKHLIVEFKNRIQEPQHNGARK